ncbi:MAG: tRNA (guanosine(46)-N7)-methyltransferase TrmB [Bacteroidales bacterium]|nr:tRNA (guanosine(46)-N7)-methyltransferase TrmB [Bacteroidales bacterium]
MSKNKLEKFAENLTFPNFFQPTYSEVEEKGFALRGKWADDFFKNSNPIILELGCGRGEYTIGLAERFANKNFIGIDRKGSRMWKGCKTSVENNMKNVAFLRMQINNITHYFGENEISEIWITFPDPQPKRSKENKRLTSPLFLDFYRRIITPDGIIHLKTDDENLYIYTLYIIENSHRTLIEKQDNIYACQYLDETLKIETYYENRWKEEGKSIKYIKFKLI